MRYRNLLSLLFSVTLLSHLLLPQTLAQTATTATISGTVTDSTGAILPGAEIELLDTGTNQIWKQLTNETGQYVFPSVLPGVYNITVMVPGFRKATATAVKVEVAKSYTINVSLEVGQVSETVHVTTSAGAELRRGGGWHCQASLSGPHPPGERTPHAPATGDTDRRRRGIARRPEHFSPGRDRCDQPIHRGNPNLRPAPDRRHRRVSRRRGQPERGFWARRRRSGLPYQPAR